MCYCIKTQTFSQTKQQPNCGLEISHMASALSSRFQTNRIKLRPSFSVLFSSLNSEGYAGPLTRKLGNI